MDHDGLHSNGLSRHFYGMTSNGVYTADTGQRKIVMAINESDSSTGIEVLNMGEALEYAKMGDGRTGTYLIEDTVPPILQMNNELAEGRWVVAFLSNPFGAGHCVVIKSFDGSNYCYWEPWIDNHRYLQVNAIVSNNIFLSDLGNERYYLGGIGYCYESIE